MYFKQLEEKSKDNPMLRIYEASGFITRFLQQAFKTPTGVQGDAFCYMLATMAGVSIAITARDNASKDNWYLYALDERIVYTCTYAFGPTAITFREYPGKYDKVYLLFIDNEYFELVFDYVSHEQYVIETEEKEIYRCKYILKENESLTRRQDKGEIIHLVGKLKCGYKNIDRNKMGLYFETDIVYEGEEYKWMR